MKIRSAATNLFLFLSLFSICAESQNYTITLFDQQNGAGNRIMTYTGPMLTNSQLNGGSISGFVINPPAMHWTTPPISADNQSGSFIPCNAYPDPGNGGPNGEANITCFSGAPGTTNGVPLFSFCFQGGAWPLPVGTYNVDSANQSSCGNYFFAYSQTPGYSSYAFLNNGSIVVVKNSTRIVTSLADDGSPGALRSVIASANSGDTITFGVTGTITLAQGPLDISKSLTVSGPGAANLAISGNHASTVLQVESGVMVGMSGVTIMNGASPGNYGGGIYNYGVLTVTNSIFSSNSAYYGAAIYNASGMLTITNSTFSGNSASIYAGGIFNDRGTLTITNSTFSANSAGGNGGGIYNFGMLTITNSTFSANSAGYGAAFFNEITATIKNTLLANGSSRNCYNVGAFNSAGYNLSDDDSCSSLFTGIGDRNDTAAGLDPNGLQSNGGPTPTIAILATSPAFNVIPLSPTNYCIAADGTTPIATDQRGIARPQVSACDIGAFEYSSDNDAGFAVLTGGNNFSGNQNVNGIVTATSFIGDGSALTGVIAASANIANLANFATSAGDAETLGGNPASAFAPATGSTNYVAKAGDTMTGTLNLPANGLFAGGNQLSLFGGNVGIGTATPEGYPGYTSLHIDDARMGFGGAFLQLTHSASSNKARIVSDANGLLLCSGCGGGGAIAAPVRIKAGEITTGTDSHIFILPNGNVGVGTVTPAAKLDVKGTANFSGLVTFATGQTFPGAGNGTITGVTPGTGLSGGGTSGNVSLTNTGILSLTAGSGLNSTSGQTPTLSLNTSFTDGRYAQLGAANTFTANQTVPNLTVSGTVSSSLGNFSANTSTQVLTVNQSGSGAGLVASASNSAGAAVSGTGGYFGLYGSGTEAGVKGESYLNFGVVGTSVKNAAIFGIGGPYGLVASGNTAGVWGQGSGTGTGLYGSNTSSTGTAGTFNVTSNGKLLSGQNNATEVFSVAGNGNVNTSGTLATVGSVTIGSGTPITRHISMLFQNVTFNAKLSPATCTVWSGTISSAADGDSVAVGMSSSLMSANIVYSAWSTNGGVQVRICNPTGAPTTVGAGNIRLDVWKH